MPVQQVRIVVRSAFGGVKYEYFGILGFMAQCEMSLFQRLRQGHRTSASFGFWGSHHAAIVAPGDPNLTGSKIDIFPGKPQDFADSQTGEQSEPDYHPYRFVQNGHELGYFVQLQNTLFSN